MNLGPVIKSSDRGASMILLATALFMLLGASAIAVDFAAMRADRSIDQKVTDSAAAAGSLAAFSAAGPTAGQKACETALAYVENNANAIDSLDDSGCAPPAFSTTCDPTMADFLTVFSGRFTITVTYPVPDTDPMMTSGILGVTTSQPVVASDGDPCERVGVEMSAIHQGLFSQLLGFDQGTTTVRTVATAFLPDEGGVPLNLLVLDRFGCQAILVQGNGGVSVNAVINEAGTGLLAGIAASDSDGSAGCTADGVIDIDGSNGVLRADGPLGCANQTGIGTVGGFDSGFGCGDIQVLAPGTPGCNLPACTAGAGGANPPNPEPTALPGRLTRAPIDHRYNCWGNYASPPAGVIWAVDALTAPEQDIPGCTDGTAANIYDLINTVGQSGKAGGLAWVADLGKACNVLADETATVGSGSRPIFVDCDNFIVEGDVAINGRNVIFKGNVEVKSQGSLEIQSPAGNPGWTFFRDGTFTKGGQSSLSIQYNAVYLSKTSSIDIAGGSNGALVWIAPDSGPFDDLALWSDSPFTHFWAGQGQLQMEGVFFTPWALADYSGTSGQNQTEAQWVAYRLLARGQGLLVIKPEFGRAVTFNFDPRTTLIR